MKRTVEMNAEEFRLGFKPRDLVPLGWRIAFWVTTTCWVIGVVSRVAAGMPPNWLTVFGAVGFVPVVSWLWDDHLRRQFNSRVLADEESE